MQGEYQISVISGTQGLLLQVFLFPVYYFQKISVLIVAGSFVSSTSYWADFWWDRNSSPDCAVSSTELLQRLKADVHAKAKLKRLEGPQILPSLLVNTLKCEDLCLTDCLLTYSLLLGISTSEAGHLESHENFHLLASAAVLPLIEAGSPFVSAAVQKCTGQWTSHSPEKCTLLTQAGGFLQGTTHATPWIDRK